MIVRGSNFATSNAEVFMSKKSGLAKEDIPSFRYDLCLC